MRDLFLRVVSTEGPYADPITWCESPRICGESHEKAAGREEFPQKARDMRLFNLGRQSMEICFEKLPIDPRFID